jgi:hypothetical protein
MRHHIPPKRWYPLTRPHAVITHKITTWTANAAKISKFYKCKQWSAVHAVVPQISVKIKKKQTKITYFTRKIFHFGIRLVRFRKSHMYEPIIVTNFWLIKMYNFVSWSDIVRAQTSVTVKKFRNFKPVGFSGFPAPWARPSLTTHVLSLSRNLMNPNIYELISCSQKPVLP